MSSPSETVHPLEAQRRLNRDAAAKLNFTPYGVRVDGLLSLQAARALHSDAADAARREHEAAAKQTPGTPLPTDPRAHAKVAGRIVLLRDNGKLLWITLRDDGADLQLAISQRDVSETAFALAKTLDLGDIITAGGRLMKTKTGEITLWADDCAIASKCLVPPPEKHAGLTDPELRYRQRYIDMWVNPETVSVFKLRSAIVASMRRTLEAAGYMEVETPMMQVLAGGAAARPFVTHMNALDINLFMRIAPELYLKRLLVGGLPKVYEINRNFRNEGLDKKHNPEFTMLEAYCAFGDVVTVMDLTESIIRSAAQTCAELRLAANPADESLQTQAKTLHLPFGELTINYADPFVIAPYPDLFERTFGFAMTNTDRVIAEAKARHLKTQGVDPVILINELFEAHAENTVDPQRPTFITDYPAAISPLTRPKPSNPYLADRADLFIAGMEVAPHYTELNDPDIQAAKFREQLATGDDAKNAEESTFRTYDHDFIHALKVGMPPAGGMGLGVDRLAMLLTNQDTLRDVLLFPLMKPV
jgi:lysyl-tRNA synthetase, class II